MVKQTVESVIFLELHPRTQIDVTLEVSLSLSHSISLSLALSLSFACALSLPPAFLLSLCG